MTDNTFEKALTDILQTYFGYEDSVIDEPLINPDLKKKKRVKKINDLEVIIYTNDHNPPHFTLKQRTIRLMLNF